MLAELSKPETRQVLQREIFPQRTPILDRACLPLSIWLIIQMKKDLIILKHAASRINANGNLLQPKQSMGWYHARY